VADDYRLGPFRMGVFDPERGTYQTLEAGPFPLRVTPGVASPAVAATPTPGDAELPAVQPKLRVEQRGEDVLDLHRDLAAARPLPALGLPILAGLFCFPPFVYLLLRLATAARRRERTIGEQMRERARRLLAEAVGARRRGETAEVVGRLQRAVTAGALGRAGRQGEVLAYQEVDGMLGPAGVPPVLCREVVEVLQGLDAARYGGELTEDRLGEWMTRSEGLVKALGRGGREA